MQTPRLSVLISPHQLEQGALGRYAQRAEVAGLHALWVTESSCDSFVFAHEVLASTERLSTGNCIAPRWKRHPLQMAETAATLAHLYPGRFAIGIGSASYVDDLRQSYGQGLDRPVARMREYVEILRSALSGAEFDYAGEFYDAVGQLPFDSGQRVPIFVAAGGPQFARMSGRVADGIFLQPDPHGTRLSLSGAMRTAADKAGRRSDELRVHQCLTVSVSATREEARDKLRRYLLEMSFIEQPHLDSLAESGYSDVAANVGRLLESGDGTAAMDAIPDEVVDLITLPLTPADSPAEVASQLAARADGVATDLILYPYVSTDAAGTDRGAARLVDEYDSLFDLLPSLAQESPAAP